MTTPEPTPDQSADDLLDQILEQLDKDPAAALEAIKKRFPQHADDAPPDEHSEDGTTPHSGR